MVGALGRGMTFMTSGPSTFLVDTNILVYSVDVTEAAKQIVATEVLSRLDLSGRGVLSAQILGESYNSMTRRIAVPLPDDDAASVVEGFADSWPVVSLSSAIVSEAMRISSTHQFSYWDALLLAAAGAYGAVSLLSEDLQDGQVVEGIRIANPLSPAFDLTLLD